MFASAPDQHGTGRSHGVVGIVVGILFEPGPGCASYASYTPPSAWKPPFGGVLGEPAPTADKVRVRALMWSGLGAREPTGMEVAPGRGREEDTDVLPSSDLLSAPDAPSDRKPLLPPLLIWSRTDRVRSL